MNNYWEEKDMGSDISSYQEKELEKMNIPQWMNLKCPFCHKKLPLRSIRSVSLKFNTRNYGDVVVEILCEDCSKMDSLYFRQEVKTMADFCSLLKGEETPVNQTPILEDMMYKLKYNNIIENMISNGDK